MSKDPSLDYGAADITVLKGLEAVRLRPGMYIGDTGKRGLHHIVKEIIDNSVDEAMAGYCDRIQVTVHANGHTITIEDNGRGIPTGIHPEEGVSALQVALTVLHAGGKFGKSEGSYKVSGGLHGVGSACVNALSETLIAEVWREGKAFRQTFQRGVPTEPCTELGPSRKRGTAITFTPDPEIFTAGTDFDEEYLIRRVRESAYLNGGLTFKYVNKKTGTEETFQYAGGIRDYVSYLSEAKTGHYPAQPFYCDKQHNDVQVQVAFQYAEEDDETIICFANNIHTPGGGTHLSGFKTALTRVVNTFGKNQAQGSATNGKKETARNNYTALSGDDIREGITTIISVRVHNPQFEGQTKDKLGSAEVEGAVQVAFGEALTEYFEKNPAIVKQIVERAQLAQKAREAAKRQAEIVKKKSAFGRSDSLPGKLRDCESDQRSERELFIVEGDSAGGAARQGRNPHTQAILPIKGKIINAEKNDLASLLKNSEVESLIKAIGAGVDVKGSDEFDLENRRYDKIIIMADADVDGSHIQSLVMTFLLRFMRPLVTEGHIYMAQAPLFRIDVGKEQFYAFSNEEMQELVTKHTKNGKRPDVVRFKGLGEMNSDELGKTTMDPEIRRLHRITINDLTTAEHDTSVLMGRNVAVRKEVIVEHSRKLKSIAAALAA